MSADDVRHFRNSFAKKERADFSSKEWKEIQARKANMLLAGQIIKKNNGGKNPILGF